MSGPTWQQSLIQLAKKHPVPVAVFSLIFGSGWLIDRHPDLLPIVLSASNSPQIPVWVAVLVPCLMLTMIYRLDQRSQECEASRIQDRNFFMRKLEETQDQVAEAKAQVENLFERLVDERHHDRRKRNVPVENDRRQSRWED